MSADEFARAIGVTPNALRSSDLMAETIRLQALWADEREAHEKTARERDYWRDLAGDLKADKRKLKAELKEARAELKRLRELARAVADEYRCDREGEEQDDGSDDHRDDPAACWKCSALHALGEIP